MCILERLLSHLRKKIGDDSRRLVPYSWATRSVSISSATRDRDIRGWKIALGMESIQVAPSNTSNDAIWC